MLQRARAPRACHEGTTIAVLVALVALPVVRIALDGGGQHRAAAVGTLLAHAAVVTTGAALYLERRLGGARGDSWLVIALTAVGVQGVYWSALSASDVVTPAHPLLSTVGLLVGVAVLLAVTRLATRLPDAPAPLAAGIVLGLAIILVRSAAAWLVPDASPDHPSASAVAVLLALSFGLVAVLAVALLGITTLPVWIRVRLSGAAVLLAVGWVTLLPGQGSWPDAIATIATTAAAVVLLTTTLDQVRTTLRTEREVMALLRRRLEDVEAEIRNDRSLVHEIRATLGGIAAASDLLHRRSTTIGPTRRAELETMMDSELARLERLTTAASAAHPGPVDLDSTILPLVVRHRLRGTTVHWEPTGETAWGRADDVAEILNVLLENARRHAPDAEVRIEVRRGGRDVEVLVRDDGPGIDPLVGSTIFAWGGRRPGSTGEGIGLSAASELAGGLGGSLRLVDSAGGGAAFALELPAVPVDHDHSASTPA